MSFAMAPQKSFLHIVKTLFHQYGILCQPNKPMWSCTSNSEESYSKLPNLKFNFLLNAEGQTQYFEMPKEAYLKPDPELKNVSWLLFTPWQFQGLGGKKGEEYWVLGAQFLQNYYSIYDFKSKKIGLVQSISSVQK
uniref:Peptidase A1 domain-containing protein n=1 Tax=Strombidium rassoulzadegani TaxID=1082188 RepID=A0A7S3CH47_9SPIT|mmetsp:Transcript_10031/g.16880  ORF Transcript_10031/g.16880 Transcript_10031/m.16880 type:complete len:136 (+) Transcript_10031:1040-1447(+)